MNRSPVDVRDPDARARAARGGPAAKAVSAPKAGSVEAAADASAEDLFRALDSSPTGLSSANAAQRLERYGPNALPEQHVSALRRLFGYFWGPIPWMIEIAAILSGAVRHSSGAHGRVAARQQA